MEAINDITETAIKVVHLVIVIGLALYLGFWFFSQYENYKLNQELNDLTKEELRLKIELLKREVN